MKPIEQAVLVGAYRDLQRLRAADPSCNHLAYSQRGAERLKIANAVKGIVRLDLPGWLHRAPSGADAVAAHRAYRKLEELGLASRTNFYGMTSKASHLALSAEGERVAAELVARAGVCQS